MPWDFFAATCAPGAGKSFFFFPPWWEYIKTGNTDLVNLAVCNPAVQLPGDIWLIGLAIIDMLLRVAGFIAIISIIAAGVSYITAGGSVEKTASARKRIYNALIGLGIVFAASGFVAFIGNKLG